MSEIEVPLALDEAGNPFKLPSTAVKWAVKKHPPGGIGRPALVMFSRKPFELPITATLAQMAKLPSGVYRCDPLNAKGERVGPPAIIEITHMDQESHEADDEADELDNPVSKGAFRLIEQLHVANQELHETQLKAMETMRQSMEQTTNAQVELTKHLASVIEAAARTVDASHGAGLSKTADEIRQIWDSVPEGSNNLATVLSSPVVTGAAHALQKFIAEAAKQGAEAATETGNQASAAATAAAAAGG